MSPAALRFISTALKSYVGREIIVGGSLVVVKNRRVVLNEAWGWKDREQAIALDPNTLFNIRSMTKMITGAAAQILIDEGALALEDKVMQYLPGFAQGASSQITIEQLLTHRSGLPLNILTNVNQYPDLQALGNAIGRQGPQFTPGSKFWYSDSGTDALGAVIEVVSGVTLDVFVRRRLLQPLGMDDSFYLTEAGAPTNRVASLYYGSTRNWTRIWTAGQPFYPFAWGAQSLYSTPLDYARFLAMLLDHGLAGQTRVLSEAAVERILTPVSRLNSLGSDSPMPTGFPGMQVHYGQMAVLYQTPVGVEVFGHSGSDGTWAWAWPTHDLIILYFTQSRGQPSGIKLESEFSRLLFNPGTVLPAETLAQYGPYCGRFQAHFDSVLGVFRQEQFTTLIHDGRLGLNIPGQFIFSLKDPSPAGRWYWQGGDSFSIQFERNTLGEVTALLFFEPGQTVRLPRTEALPPNAEPVFLNAGLRGAPGEEFATTLVGKATCPYAVDFSTDLETWQRFFTGSPPDGQLLIHDHSPAQHPRVFYRATLAEPADAPR